MGTNDPKLRERLLRETDFTHEKTVKLCRITEQSREHSRIFNPPTAQASSIDTVKKTQAPQEATKSNTNDLQRILKCKFYGWSHDRGNCPTYGATCHKCNGRNHYARCRLRPKKGTGEKRVYHVEVQLNEKDAPLKGQHIEGIEGITKRNMQSDLSVNNNPVPFKCNILPMQMAKELIKCSSRTNQCVA